MNFASITMPLTVAIISIFPIITNHMSYHSQFSYSDYGGYYIFIILVVVPTYLMVHIIILIHDYYEYKNTIAYIECPKGREKGEK